VIIITLREPGMVTAAAAAVVVVAPL